jgi:hypothetical protein
VEPGGFASSDVHIVAHEAEEVYYVEDVGDTGPMATKVRAKEA